MFFHEVKIKDNNIPQQREADLSLDSLCPPARSFIGLDPQHDEMEIEDDGIPRQRGGRSLPRFTVPTRLFRHLP
jgi:hypothetical protein